MKSNFYQRTDYNINDVQYFEQCGYPKCFAQVLSMRGFTKENLSRSLRYSQQDFYDPFAMHGMREAVDIIKQCIADNKPILIHGDYDADGLSASAVLSLFFTHNGVENDVIIPTRDTGYGINFDNVASKLQQKNYGVVLTVDCGISNVNEIAKLKAQFGHSTQFVVTDHHEIPEVLPDCICVNPKLGYPFAYLSGSGVAFKVVQALSDITTALRYADLAIIGTIADVMPMHDENRTLVKAGLANFAHKSLKKLAELCKVNCAQITANDIGMRLAPKINAAGRVGSPDVALKLLLACDKADNATAQLLMELNDKRRQIMDEVYTQAQEQCVLNKCASKRLVFVKGEDWHHGVLGIVAGKLKEAYNLPSVVMTRENDNYVGSARCIDGIDLHSLFVNAAQYLVKFGGHKSSVGFTVSSDNVDNLNACLATQLQAMSESMFTHVSLYDIRLGEDSVTANDILQFCNSIQPLMPSDELRIYVKDYVKFASTFGKQGEHISFTLGSGLQVKGFYKYTRYLTALKSGAEVELIVTLTYDTFSGTVQAILSDIALCNSLHFEPLYAKEYLRCVGSDNTQYPSISAKQAKEIVGGKQTVLCVFDSYTAFQNVCEKFVDFPDTYKLLFFCGSGDGGSAVVISPDKEYDYSAFDNVLLFCNNRKMGRIYCDNAYYVDIRIEDGLFADTVLDRELCTKVFKALKLKKHYETLDNIYDKYLMTHVSLVDFCAAVAVFVQLGLYDDQQGVVVANKKAELNDSAVFCRLSQQQK